MDESGNFEGQEKNVAKVCPALFAVLVPQEHHESLAETIQTLWNSYNIRNLHAMRANDTRNPVYLGDLITALKRHHCMLFLLRYQEDVRLHLTDALQEAFAANRFLGMAGALLEHILYLHPPLFKRELNFAFHPNSRVVPLGTGDKVQRRKIKQMEALGHHSLTFRSKRVFFIWNADSLRTKILQQALDYASWEESVGKRSFGQFETVVAEKSDNPFIHMVDHLAYLCRADGRGEKKLLEVHDTLAKASVCLGYGQIQRQYRELVRRYHAGNADEFFPDAMQMLSKTKDAYYCRALEFMLKNSLSGITLEKISHAEKLEQLAGEYLQTSRGNWQFVLDLLARLIAAVQTWPASLRRSHRCQWLLFRLYSHKLSIHNHRGEDADAWEAYDALDALALGKLDVEEFRERIGVENRVAVIMSNVFAFEQGAEKLAPVITTLENSLQVLETFGGKLYDPLIGRLRGTRAQNIAFLAPRKPALFAEAESLFIAAAQEFTRDRDKIRHDINLLHLYLDWPQLHKATEAVGLLQEYQSVVGFLENPSSATAQYMQFALSALLKYAVATEEKYGKWLAFCELPTLKLWFGPAVEEHPFEFIFGYLGRMAYSLKENEKACQYFEHALQVPSTGNPREQPTLQAIRAQIWTWWALEEEKAGKHISAAGKVAQAQSIMREIGTTDCLETMLQIKPDGTATGWFAEGWQALNGVNRQAAFDRKACDTFLDCFTFNYR
ncbi:MAG: hypothetical protein Q4G66_10755 [bacterium]|nr:hypothetical protein [bacterium]